MAYKRISPQPVIEGGTGISSATSYAPVCGGTTTTGAFQSASSGQSNSGYVLTSNGTSALPTWQAAPGGGGGNLVLIQNQTFPAASNVPHVDFTSGISGTYNTYLFAISFVAPQTAGDNIDLQFSSNGGSTWINSGYTAGCNYTTGYTSATLNNANSTSSFILTVNNYQFPAYGGNGTIWLFDITSGNIPTINGFVSYTYSSAVQGAAAFSGGSCSTTNINAFRFIASTGNITSGSFSLYGLLE